MPIVRNQLASIEYWKSQPMRPAERFYVAFCLFMSSVQDTFLGMLERERSNLNWAATCSYYGLVHAGRLFCFLAFGDFPKRHDRLRALFHPSSEARPVRARQVAGGFPFDWLQDFSAIPAGAPVPVELGRAATPQSEEYLHTLVGYFQELQVRDFERRIKKYGQIVAAAAPLRNDSNYEALLIAHEYGHERMTDAFERLSSTLAGCTEETLALSAESFIGFLKRDPDLGDRRPSYYAFFEHYLQKRMMVSIRDKLGQSGGITEQLENLVASIDIPPDRADYQDLERDASWHFFGPKQTLMKEFERRVTELERATNRLQGKTRNKPD